MQLTRKRPSVPRLGALPGTRHGALILALVCALGAAVILVFAVGQYRKTLSSGSKQDTVLVATALIQKGSSGDVIATQQLVKPTPVLEKHLQLGAISSTAALAGRVAAEDILPGEQLTATDFTYGGGIADQLAPNQRAVDITVDQSHGSLDVLQAGDRVDVYASFSAAQGSGGTPIIHVLLSNLLVLKVPAGAGGGGLAGGSSQGGDVVLAVNDNAAPNLAYTAENGKVWLLLRPGDGTSSTQTTATLSTVLASGLTGGARPASAATTPATPGTIPAAAATSTTSSKTSTGAHP